MTPGTSGKRDVARWPWGRRASWRPTRTITQAWVFRTTPSRVDVFADRARSLGAVGPFDREMYVGLGCALEKLLQAAPAHGYRARVTLLPTPGRSVHAARIELRSGPRRRSAH